MSSAFCNRAAAALVAAALLAACAGGGGQGNVMMPQGNGGGVNGIGGIANTTVKIYVPAGAQVNNATTKPFFTPPALPGSNGALISPQVGATPPATTPPPVATPPPAPGSQLLSINVTGPTTIAQNVSVGPNSGGCSPSQGGSTCQFSLSLPVGTYTGTIGGTAIAFTVAPGSGNALNLTLNAVPAQVAIVAGSFTSAPNVAGGIDLFGSGKHPLVVEVLDANQNVIVGGGATFTLSQAGGSLPVSVTPVAAMGPNAFYVTPAAAPSGSAATLRASQSAFGPANPCAQPGAVCSGTTRIDVKQILAVANSGSSSVTLYVNGEYTPLATIQNGVTTPQALIFDAAGDLFVANQPGSVAVFTPPYNQSPIAIAAGVNHPQALVIDARGDLFVANGNGSNTATVYSPPYGGPPATTISTSVDDPVSLALDATGDLFVVNAASNAVTEYAPPYSGAPTVLSKGLNAPNSVALDARGNLFVANLNSTPNSIVEYAPPFSGTSAPIATITNGINEQGSIAAISMNLFVPNQGANTVTQYAAPYTGTPTTIVGGQSQPVALAIDTAGNLYVANYGNNTVTEYASPYAPGAWTTIATGVNAPVALALSPPTNGGPTLLP
jgi:hypothetical protein